MEKFPKVNSFWIKYNLNWVCKNTWKKASINTLHWFLVKYHTHLGNDLIKTPSENCLIYLTKFLDTEKNAGCGPPYHNGTPNLCELPKLIFRPNSPGEIILVKANKSVIPVVKILFFFTKLYCIKWNINIAI